MHITEDMLRGGGSSTEQLNETDKWRLLVHFQERLRYYGLVDWPVDELKLLAEWCAQYYGHIEKGTVSPRGLALFGNVGTGKSTAVRIISKIFRLDYYDVGELAMRFGTFGNDWLYQWLNETANSVIVLDDPGAEPDVNYYGAKFPMSAILSKRYNCWQMHGTLTVLTGNLKHSQRVEAFGERPADRIQEMFEIIKCVWGSFRKNGTPGAD